MGPTTAPLLPPSPSFTLTGDVISPTGMTISGGTVRLGDGGTSGSIIGDVVNNGALIYDRSDSYIDFGAISGSGTLTHQGSGTTTLAAVNSYTGLTSVNAGQLDVDGVIAGSAQVAADATLLGSGSINGTVTVLAGGHLTPGELPGEGAGTLRVGSLVLNPGSQLDYNLGIPNIVGGTVNDHLIAAGALTLDGVLNITDLGGFSRGVYQLIAYGGALIDNVLDIGILPSGFPIGGVSISTATPGQVNLVVATGGFNLQYWDGPNGFGNSQVDGGSGFWNPFYSNWTNETGTFNTDWQEGFAVFQGAPGTVTLGGFMSIEGMQFRTDGYTVQGGDYRLLLEPAAIVSVDAGVTATVSA